MCAPYGVLGLKAEEEAGGEVLDVVHAVHVTRGPRGLGQQITCEYCGKCRKNLQTEERSPLCCMSVRLVLQLYLFFVAYISSPLKKRSNNIVTSVCSCVTCNGMHGTHNIFQVSFSKLRFRKTLLTPQKLLNFYYAKKLAVISFWPSMWADRMQNIAHQASSTRHNLFL